MPEEKTGQIYHLFADILDYPTPRLLDRVVECVTLVSRVDPEVAAELEGFRVFVEETPLGRLEEIYTGIFDLQAVCYPYAGYQLFGESYKRGAFMAELKGRYSANGFSEGKELPDHVSVILRFLAILRDEDEGRVMVDECLIPALNKMADAFRGNSNPYGGVVQALLLVLQVPRQVTVGRGSEV